MTATVKRKRVAPFVGGAAVVAAAVLLLCLLFALWLPSSPSLRANTSSFGNRIFVAVLSAATSFWGTTRIASTELDIDDPPSPPPLGPAPRYWPKYGGSHRAFLLDDATAWETTRLSGAELDGFDSMDPNFRPSNLFTKVHCNNNTDGVGASSCPPSSSDGCPSCCRRWSRASIPSCVDAAPPGLPGYRGVSFFRRTLPPTVTDASNVVAATRIVFQACSFYCRVWIRGKEIGHHLAGGYVAFYLDVPPDVALAAASAETDIFVLADNRFNGTTAPMHTGGDFWHYGGIMRSIEWHQIVTTTSSSDLPRQQQQQRRGPWPWRCYVFTESLDGTVRISCQLMTGSVGNSAEMSRYKDADQKLHVSVSFDNDIAHNETVTVAGSSTANGVVDLGTFRVPEPRVWWTTDPQLHTVTVSLNGASVTERFGLRIFGTDREGPRTRFTLNGQVLKLVGWSHHMQWPDGAGASPSDAQLDADMGLLKKGGANFVRGAHYPQDPRWLDRLDENGMVVWCETLGPAIQLSNLRDSYFLKHHVGQLNEMMDNAMNHAGIAVWAFANEGPSHLEEACSAYRTFADTIRKRDPTRLVSYASNKKLADKCFDVVSLLALNSYPSWYSSDEPRKFWNRMADTLASGTVAGTDGKPFVISETGAGGIYEWSRNRTVAKWTLAYQTKVVTEDVDVALDNSNISGIALWHFMDFKVDDAYENYTQCQYVPGAYPPTCAYIDVSGRRPGGLNHKGCFDFWRREKPVFRAVAARYSNVTAAQASGRIPGVLRGSYQTK